MKEEKAINSELQIGDLVQDKDRKPSLGIVTSTCWRDGTGQCAFLIFWFVNPCYECPDSHWTFDHFLEKL